jgi:hypothetical protein
MWPSSPLGNPSLLQQFSRQNPKEVGAFGNVQLEICTLFHSPPNQPKASSAERPIGTAAVAAEIASVAAAVAVRQGVDRRVAVQIAAQAVLAGDLKDFEASDLVVPADSAQVSLWEGGNKGCMLARRCHRMICGCCITMES